MNQAPYGGPKLELKNKENKLDRSKQAMNDGGAYQNVDNSGQINAMAKKAENLRAVSKAGSDLFNNSISTAIALKGVEDGDPYKEADDYGEKVDAENKVQQELDVKQIDKEMVNSFENEESDKVDRFQDINVDDVETMEESYEGDGLFDDDSPFYMTGVPRKRK